MPPVRHKSRLSRKEACALVASIILWLAVTALFVGMRPEHFILAGCISALFLAGGSAKRLVVALLPFAVFGISYDWMNIVPNYEVNPIDIEGIYNAEKSLFGIAGASGGIMTPNEYLGAHTTRWMDFLGGVFYLCWVPVPIAFGLWLYAVGQRREYLHFAIVFLLVNLLGFAGYYIHPAAPPWYVAQYGFEPIMDTGGNVAGLAGFGEITGWKVFEGLYSRNANVFAAVPSLHSAYVLIAFIYSMRAKCPAWMRAALALISAGIWFTAVYTSHHYVIDVLLGIGVSFLGYVIFEYGLMRLKPFASFMSKYASYISPAPHYTKINKQRLYPTAN